MSRIVNIGVLCLKAFTGLWAIITFSVAASLQSKFIGTCDSVGAIIAAGVMTMLWVIVSLVLQLTMRETIIISVMVDTFVYGVIFILALGGTAAESRNTDVYQSHSIGNATIALGSILVFLLFAIIVFQLIYTLPTYGGSKKTWFTPFHVLVADETPRVTGDKSAGIDNTVSPVGHQNRDMTQTVPQADLGTLDYRNIP